MRRSLPKARIEILREVERIAAAAAVGEADVEQTEIGAPACRERIEGELAGVVVGKGLLEPNQLARGAAVVGVGGRVLGGPFEQDRVVRAGAAARLEVGRRRGVAGVGEGVELAEAARAGLVELRMEGEALEAALVGQSTGRSLPRPRALMSTYGLTVLPS